MRYLLGASAILGLVCLLWWNLPKTQNFVLTAKMNTPIGERSATVIRQLSFENLVTFGLNLTEISVTQAGEALVLPIEDRPSVFVLMNKQGRGALAMLAAAMTEVPGYPHPRSRVSVWHWPRQIDETNRAFPVPKKNHPTVVIFGDEGDRNSIRVLDDENFARNFDEGYDFPELSVQFTDAKVSLGRIRELLPWPGKVSGGFQPPHESTKKALSLPRPFFDHFVRETSRSNSEIRFGGGV